MVIGVIGVMVAAAAPSFVEWMKDSRVTDAAQNIRDMYRNARARAMGRGSAMYVRWHEGAAMPTNAIPIGQFILREAVTGPATPFHQALPVSSCTATDWSLVATTSRFIKTFEPRRDRYEPAETKFYDWNSNAVGWAGICFTPRGRVFYQDTDGGGFVRMAGVPRVEVENTDSTHYRTIIIPPTGAARLVLGVN